MVSNLECGASKDLKDEPSKERGRLFCQQREPCVQMLADRKVAPCGGCKVSKGGEAWPKNEEVGGGQSVQNLVCFVKEFCFDSQCCEKP